MLWHICRCGAYIPQNISICAACTAGRSGQISRHMEYNKFRRNKKAAAFYVSADWRKVRADVLRLYDGLDIYAYYIQYKIVMADMVHHIIPIEADWSKRFDKTNLLPLSRGNHGVVEALYDKNDVSKRDTQKLLCELVDIHWKEHGGILKVLEGFG